MLFPRILTAIIGIPIILFVIYLGGLPFFIVFLGVTTLALYEYFENLKLAGYDNNTLLGVILGSLLFISVFINGLKIAAYLENQITAAVVTSIIVVSFFRYIFTYRPKETLKNLGILLIGIFFISWGLSHLILIRNLKEFGTNLTYFLFFIIWIEDTASYFLGAKFGKHPFFSRLSPKKTLEGYIAGIISAILISIPLYFLLLKNFFPLYKIVTASLIVALITPFSDLSESLIKREINIKDSSNILPGHGGFFDRFDSFFFASPIFYYLLS